MAGYKGFQGGGAYKGFQGGLPYKGFQELSAAVVVTAPTGGIVYGKPVTRDYLADLRLPWQREEDFEARMRKSIADALDEEWLEAELV